MKKPDCRNQLNRTAFSRFGHIFYFVDTISEQSHIALFNNFKGFYLQLTNLQIYRFIDRVRNKIQYHKYPTTHKIENLTL